MVFGTDFRLSNLEKVIPITIGDKQIKRVNNIKYLGVYLDENLKWANHIDNPWTKISHSINCLKQDRNYASLDILQVIYNALIQPVFDVCDVVWGNLNKGLASRIKKLQNHAARIVSFQGYNVRSADLLNYLNG